MQTHTEIGVENRNLGPGAGTIDPQPRDCSADPFPRASMTTSRPNEPLKSQLVRFGEARFQAEGGGLLPSRPRWHRQVQDRFAHGAGGSRHATRVRWTASAAGWKDDTCLELQDAILRFPFPFRCWVVLSSQFTSGIDLHGQSNLDSVLHLSGVDRITIQHASMLASTNAALAR